MQTEKDLENYLKKQCKENAIECYKFSSPSRRGVPDDILIAFPNIIVFVELKSPAKTGNLSRLQKREIELLEQYDCQVFILDSVERVDNLIGYLIEEMKRKRRA